MLVNKFEEYVRFVKKGLKKINWNLSKFNKYYMY